MSMNKAGRILTVLGYEEDEILHEMIASDGWSDAVMERMSRNIKHAKKNNPELFSCQIKTQTKII